jgi:hypothetical protein
MFSPRSVHDHTCVGRQPKLSESVRPTVQQDIMHIEISRTFGTRRIRPLLESFSLDLLSSWRVNDTLGNMIAYASSSCLIVSIVLAGEEWDWRRTGSYAYHKNGFHATINGLAHTKEGIPNTYNSPCGLSSPPYRWTWVQRLPILQYLFSNVRKRGALTNLEDDGPAFPRHRCPWRNFQVA